MNYFRHMNGFFARLAEDKRMSSYHISLYFALFQQWNADRFGEQFVITRAETMEMSRLGSVNTYARCMKELSQWGYIQYIPASNIHAGRRVSCIRFDTASDIASSTATDTPFINSLNKNKQEEESVRRNQNQILMKTKKKTKTTSNEKFRKSSG